MEEIKKSSIQEEKLLRITKHLMQGGRISEYDKEAKRIDAIADQNQRAAEWARFIERYSNLLE